MSGDEKHLQKAGSEHTPGTRDLGAATGMSRLQLHEVCLPPEAESDIISGCARAESFVYVLAGRGVLSSERAQFEVAAGDFVGITEPGSTRMQNPFSEDLVYFSGTKKS